MKENVVATYLYVLSSACSFVVRRHFQRARRTAIFCQRLAVERSSRGHIWVELTYTCAKQRSRRGLLIHERTARCDKKWNILSSFVPVTQTEAVTGASPPVLYVLPLVSAVGRIMAESSHPLTGKCAGRKSSHLECFNCGLQLI